MWLIKSMQSSIKNSSRKGKFLILFLIPAIILAIIGIVGWGFVYSIIYKPNIDLKGQTSAFLYIHTGSSFPAVVKELTKNKFLKNAATFERIARWKKYDTRVKPGRYRIFDRMNNNDLVKLLRSGKQEPVKVIFNSLLTKEDLAGKISSQIEADSVSLLELMNDPSYLTRFNVPVQSVFVLFLPNTYEFYWNTSADQFMNRMSQESKKFWNSQRKYKALAEGLTIPEVVILASIVERETTRDIDKPIIAGVYMNRLKKNWPLQADPTIIFAANDYSIKRVLDKHKEIHSPYNTYTHTGFPPGPICLPSVSSIDAVLNFQHHAYMYFCARDDLSGYHNFAVTLAEHNRNAKRYQAALKRFNIR
jgi:UPF0755 protein